MSKKRTAEKPPVKKSRRVIGAPPGSFKFDHDGPPSRVTAIAYGPDEMQEVQLNNLDNLAMLSEKFPVLWVNVDGPVPEVLEQLGKLFKLHHLALEDVAHVGQRAKIEQYKGHIFFVTHMVSLDETVEVEQLSIFLTDTVVLTFQEHPGDCLDSIRERIRKKLGRVRDAGADYLAYAILDAVTDHYFPVLEEYGEQLEALEDRLVTNAAAGIIGQVQAVKRDMLKMRRVVWPLRDAVNSLLRDGSPQFSEDSLTFMRDCYDHVSRIIDSLETYRELASDLTSLQQAAIGNQMNAVMKVLTIIATIFIPLTFIAGIYGMNFDPETSAWNMPELQWAWGYPVCLAVMGVTTLAMLYYFKRKKWL